MSLLTRGGGQSEGEDEGSDPVLLAARMAAADIALITDADHAITHVSDSFMAMTGYTLADLAGLNCRVLQGPGTDPDTKRQMREVLASKEVFEGQVLNYRKDGSAFWTALKIIPVRLPGRPEVTHFVSVQRDITNKVALLKQVQTQAQHDYVTGLPNRAAAEQALAEVVKRTPHPTPDQNRPLGQAPATAAVCLIDLDDFRIVNNTLGHAAGDEVLQQWATRVLARLREGDLLARMGGDEFLLILANISRDTSDGDLTGILERIHRAVETPFLIDGQRIRIGMSMGLALVPEDGTDTRTILRHADQALYTAKERLHQGGSWWKAADHAHTLSPDSPDNGTDDVPDGNTGRNSITGRAVTCEEYRGMVRTGNILVHFQPIVDLRDGSVALFEALARLELPGGRIAYPDAFLPHLNADDLLILFAHVLDQGLGLIGAWDREGIRPNVGVNLPPEILHDPTLPALVGQLLRTHEIEPGGLGLELLESNTMGLEAQRAALHELADLGVRLAMDDLGSGHSSLQRLSSFPFNAIKLDRGLFRHAYDKPLETLSVMATLIQMGRDLGMTVVVEGLEDESLTEAAIILGAPLGQGYYFGRPMTAQDCGPWFDTFEPDLHHASIRTPLGALAYHWQFARLTAPHPLDLENCPLTRFIHQTRTTNTNPHPDRVTNPGLDPDSGLDLMAGTDADDGAGIESWHALQHTPQGMHPASSRLFIHWLTQHIHTPTPAPAP